MIQIQASNGPKYLTNREAASFLRLSPRTAGKATCRGRRPAFKKFGSRVLMPRPTLKSEPRNEPLTTQAAIKPDDHFSPQKQWCGRSDSNRHGLLRWILNPLRLPFRHARNVDFNTLIDLSFVFSQMQNSPTFATANPSLQKRSISAHCKCDFLVRQSDEAFRARIAFAKS